jgi:dTDP-4-amino-4,6-dideoxygalactose transaminase
MLVTNDDALAEYARVLRVHGGKPKYYHHYVGGNFRMDTLQCALLSVKVKRYAQYTADRQRNAAITSPNSRSCPAWCRPIPRTANA